MCVSGPGEYASGLFMNQKTFPMITKEEKRTIYVSDDGREYLTEEECLKREDYVKNVLGKIRYFRLEPTEEFEKNETHARMFVENLAVYADKWHYEIAMQFALNSYRAIFKVRQNVQFASFKLVWIDEDEFNKPYLRNRLDGNGVMEVENILLSPIDIYGFPEKWDYSEPLHYY